MADLVVVLVVAFWCNHDIHVNNTHSEAKGYGLPIRYPMSETRFLANETAVPLPPGPYNPIIPSPNAVDFENRSNMLTGEKKKVYQREYMRRRRSNAKASKVRYIRCILLT